MKTEKLRKLSMTKREGAAWALCLVLAAALVIGAVSAGSWYGRERDRTAADVIECCYLVMGYTGLTESSEKSLYANLEGLKRAIDAYEAFQGKDSGIFELWYLAADARAVTSVLLYRELYTPEKVEKAQKLLEKIWPFFGIVSEYRVGKRDRRQLENALKELREKMDAGGYSDLHQEVYELNDMQ